MKFLKWFWFLSKRLYKKLTFVLLICLVPLSVAALRITAAQKSGIVRIAIVNRAGSIGDQIIADLDGNTGVLNYSLYDTPEKAAADLGADKQDMIWVFPEDMEKRIADFVRHPDSDHYIVEIIKKEDSLKTRLALEKLSGALYPHTSRLFFLKRVREDPDLLLENLTDEQIYKYYDDYFNEGELFKFTYPDDDAPPKTNERNYMTSPVRGLLSVIVLLAGLAAAMLYVSDEKKGVFSFVKKSDRLFISLFFELTAIVNIGFFAFCSLFILGVNTFFWREIAIFLVFMINTALFCGILCALIRSLAVLAPVSILVTVLDVFICPIFFDYYIQKTPQLLLPNAYYINSAHSGIYLLYSLIYSAVLLCITFCLYWKKRKQ